MPTTPDAYGSAPGPLRRRDCIVEQVLGTDGAVAWFTAADGDPLETHVYRIDGGAAPERLDPEPGLADAVVAGGTVALRTFGADAQHPETTIMRGDGASLLASDTEEPVVDPRPRYALLGPRDLPAALLLPAGHEADVPIPVLLSPYGARM